MRKQLRHTQLQTELDETLKQMFLSSRKLVEQHFTVRHADVINTFVVPPSTTTDSCITGPLSAA